MSLESIATPKHLKNRLAQLLATEDGFTAQVSRAVEKYRDRPTNPTEASTFCPVLPLSFYSDVRRGSTEQEPRERVLSELCEEMFAVVTVVTRHRSGLTVELQAILGATKMHLQQIGDLKLYAELPYTEIDEDLRVGDSLCGMISSIERETEKIILTCRKKLPSCYPDTKLAVNPRRLQYRHEKSR